MVRFLSSVSAMVISATLMATACPRQAIADIGQPAPALVVPELDGQTFDLSALRGQVVIVNFWATWCAPCRQEMPALDAFFRRYHCRGLEMIGLSMDRRRDRAEVPKVMQSFSYPAAILDDAKVNDFDSPDGVPVTFVIDRKGVVRAELTADKTPITENTLSDLVLPLLANHDPCASSSPNGQDTKSPLQTQIYQGVPIAQSQRPPQPQEVQ